MQAIANRAFVSHCSANTMDVESPRTPKNELPYVRMGLRDVSSTTSFAPSCQAMGMETSSESLPACGPSTEYSHSALSSELSSTAIDSDNPFADSPSGSPCQAGRFSQNPELSPLRNCQDTSFRKTAFMDDPKAISVPIASNWKLPRSLSRGNSQAAPESSPLRWSFSNVQKRKIDPRLSLSLPRGRSESAASFEGPDSDRSYFDTGRSHHATTAPLFSSASVGAVGSAGCSMGPLLKHSNRLLSWEHSRRLEASEPGTMDPYLT